MLSPFIPAGRRALTGNTRENGQYRTSGEDRRCRQTSLQTALDPGYTATCSEVLTGITQRQGQTSYGTCGWGYSVEASAEVVTEALRKLFPDGLATFDAY